MSSIDGTPIEDVKWDKASKSEWNPAKYKRAWADGYYTRPMDELEAIAQKAIASLKASPEGRAIIHNERYPATGQNHLKAGDPGFRQCHGFSWTNWDPAKPNERQRCERRATTGHLYCEQHGGRLPRGVNHKNFMMGKYSQVMPPRLVERYNETLEDPDFLVMKDEIALLTARISDLLTRVDAGESFKTWQQLNNTWLEYKAALAMGQMGKPRQNQLVERMDQVLSDGTTDFEAWMQIDLLIQSKRKLTESERKRLVEAQQMVTTEETMVLLVAIREAIKRHVRDPATIQAIATDLSAVLHHQPRQLSHST